MFKIYGLMCPRAGAIRYIGKTKNSLERRLKAHLADARSGKYKHHAACWLRGLISQGLAPEIILLEESEGDWVKAEVSWIARGRDLGWPLTNSTIGGDGALEPTPEVLRRKRKVMRQVWERPEFVQRMKEVRNDPVFLDEQACRLRTRWKNKEARQKMMDSRWPEDKRAIQAKAIMGRQQKIQAALTPEVIARRNLSIKASWAKRKAAKA